MQQLLNCPTPIGPGSCCEYPYSPSGSDCVRQCLEAYFSSSLTKLDTNYFVGMSFGVEDLTCKSSGKATDLIMLIDLLVGIFEDMEMAVAAGSAPLTMQEIWDKYGLKCIAARFQRKYGINLSAVYPLAGLIDPTGYVPYDIASIPVPGAYTCGQGPMPGPYSPQPPSTSCFIGPDLVTEDVICSPTVIANCGVLTPDALFAASVPAPVNGTVYSILCCGNPLFFQWTLVGGWLEYVFTPGEIVGANSILYVDQGSGPGMLFPSVTLIETGAGTGEYNVAFTTPQTAQDRDIVVQVFNGSTWSTIFNGTESGIPATVTILGAAPEQVRATYTIGDCQYVSLSTNTTIQPGNCVLPRDHDCLDHDLLDHS